MMEGMSRQRYRYYQEKIIQQKRKQDQEKNKRRPFCNFLVRLSHDLGKRMLSNPKKGPLHYRSPARMVWRVIRGMMPHKTKKGALALERLTVFEGIPHPFDKMKRSVMPLALKNLKVRPVRKSCRLGDLAKSIGWHHNELVDRLETKRKTKAAAWYTSKKVRLELFLLLLMLCCCVVGLLVCCFCFFWQYKNHLCVWRGDKS